MLREAPSRQRTREPRRRWFSDADFDLVVWLSDTTAIVEFQLCYDKSRDERALTWSVAGEYVHSRVDTGETTPLKNLTPILLSDGQFPRDRVIAEFMQAARDLEPALRSFIVERLQECPS